MTFSFLIVNFNGINSGVLEPCISSVVTNAPKGSQIVVCDNGSTDDSVAFLQNVDANILILKNESNIGPSRARSNAMSCLEGDIIVIMDNDALVKSVDFNAIAETYVQNPRLAILQPLILIASAGTVDYFGDFITRIGFLHQKHPPLVPFSGMLDGPVLSAKSAAMFIRREALEITGGFDSDYVIYVEETDLGWKCWLMGYENYTYRDAVFLHGFGSTTNELSKREVIFNSGYYGVRNYLGMLFSNLELRHAVLTVPIHFVVWIAFSFHCLLFKRELWRFFCQVGGAFAFLHSLPMWMQKRKWIQRERVKSDKELFPFILHRVELRQMILKAIRRPTVGNYKGYRK